MEILKRYYRLIAVLVIVFTVVLYFDRGFSSDDTPQTEDVAVLLEQVDDVIAKMQDNGAGEATEKQVPSVAAQAGPGDEERQAVSTQAAEVTDGGKEAGIPSVTDESAVAKTDSSAESASTATVGMAAEQLWQEARLAAWQGNSALAIRYYQLLLAQQPDNFDAYGEMGNVMLSSGDREGAADAYYQAAVMLNTTPNRMMAWHLLHVLAWLAPEKADKLYRELLLQP